MAREALRALIDRLEPRLRDAFLASIQDIQSRAQIALIESALRNGDVAGAIRAIGIQAEAFEVFDRAIEQAYVAGGVAATEAMPAIPDPFGPGRLVMRFDGRNPRAESWLRQHSSTLIVQIVEDQREAVRIVAEAGYERGENPRSTALDIVGRVSRTTGRREGGILGLTSAQARYVETARAQLLSGDPDQLRAYLGRERRDRRFDRAVLKAIREGRPLAKADVQKIVGRYSDRLLALRGETIARTESGAAAMEAQREAYQQQIDAGAIAEGQVRRVWVSARDFRTRDSHAAVHRESVGFNERFSNGLLYPLEPGAPAAEVINCRCTVEMRVDFLGNA